MADRKTNIIVCRSSQVVLGSFVWVNPKITKRDTEPSAARQLLKYLIIVPTFSLILIFIAKVCLHVKRTEETPVITTIIPLQNVLEENSDVSAESSNVSLAKTREPREIPFAVIPFESVPKFESLNDLQPFYNIQNEESFQNHNTKVLYLKVPIDDTITAFKIQPNPNKVGGIEVDLISDSDKQDFFPHPVFRKSDSTEKGVRKVQADTMKLYMDSSVDPCYDFYQFACGNWVKYNPIPPDKIGYDTFEVLRERLDNILNNLLSQDDFDKFPSNSKYPKVVDPEDSITKARNFYKSCMNEDLLNKRGGDPLLEFLRELGGWPIIEPSWDESQFDLIWLVGQLRRYNNDILISEWVGPDIRNANEYIIQFDQTTLGLSSKQYFLDESNSKYLEAYRVYMITIATLLGAPVVNATQDADDIINFETQLALIVEAPDQRKNISDEYMRVTLGELHTLVPQIQWIRYLNIFMDTKVQATQRVVSFCTDYFQDLVLLLSQTPQRTIANYLLWRFVRNRINNLDKRFQDAKQRFYYVLFGREKSPPRWQICVTQVNSNMGMALGGLFVQHYFDEASKNDTLRMTKEIQQTFRELLSRISWLDEDTKILARVKIDAMRLRIGYPKFILDKKELSKRYEDVTIHSDLYFENSLSILKHLTRTEHLRLGTKVDKLMWTAPPAVVNAYYSRNKNQIMFPAGILQPPFYHRHFPRALNYGGIGVVIGHELTHGFDDKGRLFDKEGNLHRWWRDFAVEAFHNKAQCLIDQYNKYIVSEVNLQVDGVTTQGENIADNGGLKEAYRAYIKWLQKNPALDETLPGVSLTNTQLFFLNFAQVWCGSSRLEGMENKLKGDVHAPGRYRVIGSLSNSVEFAEAYKCPLGSPMNPITKCSVW